MKPYGDSVRADAYKEDFPQQDDELAESVIRRDVKATAKAGVSCFWVEPGDDAASLLNHLLPA